MGRQLEENYNLGPEIKTEHRKWKQSHSNISTHMNAVLHIREYTRSAAYSTVSTAMILDDPRDELKLLGFFFHTVNM